MGDRAFCLMCAAICVATLIVFWIVVRSLQRAIERHIKAMEQDRIGFIDFPTPGPGDVGR